MPSDKLYTPQQKANCVLWYHESKSPKDVGVKFRREYGRNAKTPSPSGIIGWYQKFKATGTVLRKKKQGTKYVLTEETMQAILNIFRDPDNDGLSTRKAAAMEGMPSRASIRNTLKVMLSRSGICVIFNCLQAFHFHPYKVQHRHLLNRGDREIRVRVATEHLRLLNIDFTLLGRLMFSDEAHFLLNGHVNHQNFRYWDDHNPHRYEEDALHPERVTVWAAIGKDGVIGPVFDSVGPKRTVTWESYLHLLQVWF